ncbi:phosphopantetheine-binding protein [Pseudomonas fluorescens]|jgi:acyl carrier protein|uniref:phosphopantetheine-binding protein n=1 Tax=Pseudomonas fluorescens TaxID=294 RepID=UPI00277F4401|nr:phosphopantetheine-binding protein [Pseudomonas fluorescens]MDP9781096.1 acyl carrier protein [Pseudomonas fluorescens]
MNTPVVNICVESRVIQLLSGYFSVMQYKINSRSRLVEDLNADSVDIVEVIVIMDEAFNIELSSSQVAEWRTVVDIVNSIASSEGMQAVIEDKGEPRLRFT